MHDPCDQYANAPLNFSLNFSIFSMDTAPLSLLPRQHNNHDNHDNHDNNDACECHVTAQTNHGVVGRVVGGRRRRVPCIHWAVGGVHVAQPTPAMEKNTTTTTATTAAAAATTTTTTTTTTNPQCKKKHNTKQNKNPPALGQSTSHQ